MHNIKSIHFFHTLAVILLIAAAAGPAKAAVDVYSGGTPPADQKIKAIPEIKTPKPTPAEVQGSAQTIKVQGFRVSGNKAFSSDRILAILAPYQGQDLTLAQLRGLADSVTRLYWDQGYVTSFAYLPAQKVDGGIVEIAVLEGAPGQTIVEGNKYYTSSFIEGYTQDLAKDSILSSQKLERALLLLNDFPKLNVNATLTKGTKPQTSDIVLEVQEKSYPFAYNLFFNNFGSTYTGQYRTGLTCDLGNLTKNGDILSLTAIVPEKYNRLLYWKAGYTLPWGGQGLKFNVNYSSMGYILGEDFSPLGMEGESEIWSGGLTYPFIRSRSGNLTAEMNLKKKRFQNFLFEKTYLSSSDVYSTVDLGVSGNQYFTNNQLFYGVSTTVGLGNILGGTSSADYNRSSRPGLAGPRWARFNLDLTNITKLGDFKLVSKASGQFSLNNLVTEEQFVIGGPDTVRGYPTGEALGDHGLFLSAELRTPLLPVKSQLNDYANWALFVDGGSVSYKDAYPGEKKTTTLIGFGAGLRVTYSDNFNLRFDAAWPKNSDASDGKRGRFWFSASLDF